MRSLGLDWRTASMDEIRLAYIEHLRGVASGHKAEDGDDLVKERVLTERVDRELKLLDLAEKRGVLVNVGKLEPALSQMVGAFRSELLALPDRIADELSALYGIDVDAELITAHLCDALAQCARYVGGDSVPHTTAVRATASAGADRHNGVGAEAPPSLRESNGQAGAI